jgi:hypothetical protein
MILVKCTEYKNSDDDGIPCILVVGELIIPVKAGNVDGEEWEVATWTNNTMELLPNPPARDEVLGLVPYPLGTTPIVTASKTDIYGVRNAPLYFFFRIYDTHFDPSEMIGRIYSIIVVGRPVQNG